MDTPPSSELGRAGLVVAGKFRLDSVIGRGGMGTVWSATHVGLGHRLALKLIAREYLRSPEALRRFEMEAKAAARLQSRHVVQVFDNGTLDDGTPFIAMELLVGESVAQRVQRCGRLSLAEAVEILAQSCKALARGHSAGIVHRDIKPDNIFVAREADDDTEVVKLLDFGVAKMALELDADSRATGTGALLGTPLYMSPEQVRGARDVDLRTDLYALGLVAFTMLTGRDAIDGNSFGDILIKICTQPLPSLAAAVPGLPPGMDGWFRKACAQDAADRFASAQEFIDALRAAALIRHSAPIRVPVGGPTFGQSAMVAPTPVAPRPDVAGPPMPELPPLRALRPAGVGYPAFAQSAAAVSVSAAGLPRRRGTLTLVASLTVAILIVAGTMWRLVSWQHGDSVTRPTTAASATASLPTASSATAPLADPSAPAASSAALVTLAEGKPGAEASATPSSRLAATPPSASPSAVKAPTQAASAQVTAPRATATRHIDLGY